MNAYPSRALISKSAFLHNFDRVRALTESELMPIVKADAYGHGRERIASWASQAGATWLGVAQLGEALELRKVHPTGHILTWMYAPNAPLADAIAARLDISLGAQWAIDELEAAARLTGTTARVHIKIDTGMSRGGFSLPDLMHVAGRLFTLQYEGIFEIVGLWSHLACADDLDSAITAQQVAVFEQGRTVLDRAGIVPHILHLAASAGILWHPQTHYDMVRPGILLYGLSPEPAVAKAHDLGLKPVMTLRADLIVDRQVPPGAGISYGHTYTTSEPTHIGVVPLGYADGIPYQAAQKISVLVAQTPAPILGRVCMDQFVVETPHPSGATAEIFGSRSGYTADDIAKTVGTIGYEIVTRIGSRVPRISVD